MKKFEQILTNPSNLEESKKTTELISERNSVWKMPSSMLTSHKPITAFRFHNIFEEGMLTQQPNLIPMSIEQKRAPIHNQTSNNGVFEEFRDNAYDRLMQKPKERRRASARPAKKTNKALF